ncbi:hypothetical protein CLV59_103151 [Chitinophaga dinghuensis]|uniref:Uncharacterized protein n=1 Tax=Chitinophaga dinghuensis TaxID=1539050 RepID=A0A327W1J5_9BACT|nr:CvpA family protein [Chitinophaga dinghuensis]RAJ83191.1 hypothetical protein CLV59_103151 [Chitinophaga dinghuensis]
MQQSKCPNCGANVNIPIAVDYHEIVAVPCTYCNSQFTAKNPAYKPDAYNPEHEAREIAELEAFVKKMDEPVAYDPKLEAREMAQVEALMREIDEPGISTYDPEQEAKELAELEAFAGISNTSHIPEGKKKSKVKKIVGFVLAFLFFPVAGGSWSAVFQQPSAVTIIAAIVLTGLVGYFIYLGKSNME